MTASDRDELARRFEFHRPHLRAVALRMLGSSHEADDAVQEAWLRLARAEGGAGAGADAVARVFAGGARAARLALVDGLAGAVWSVGGRPRSVFDFTVRDGRVVGIDVLMDPGTLDLLEVAPPGE